MSLVMAQAGDLRIERNLWNDGFKVHLRDNVALMDAEAFRTFLTDLNNAFANWRRQATSSIGSAPKPAGA